MQGKNYQNIAVSFEIINTLWNMIPCYKVWTFLPYIHKARLRFILMGYHYQKPIWEWWLWIYLHTKPAESFYHDYFKCTVTYKIDVKMLPKKCPVRTNSYILKSEIFSNYSFFTHWELHGTNTHAQNNLNWMDGFTYRNKRLLICPVRDTCPVRDSELGTLCIVWISMQLCHNMS